MNSTLRLAAVATALIEGEPVDAAEREWVRSYSRRVKAASEPQPDKRAGRIEQGRLLVEYAATMSAKPSAEFLHRRLLAYQTSAWLYQRALTAPPERHAIFWKMLKLHDSVPSARTIRRLLANSSNDAGNGQRTRR